MESAFAWLGHLVEWLGCLVPRMKIVRSTHAGVKFRHGSTALAIKPGLCFYWPIVTEVETIPVVRQTHNLPSQSLTTKDGKKVVVSGVVVYEIKDIIAAMSHNWDVSDTINDISMWAITQVVSQHDYSYILQNITGAVQRDLTRVARHRLSQYGVKVYRAFLTDFSTALVIKQMGGGASTVLPGKHNME